MCPPPLELAWIEQWLQTARGSALDPRAQSQGTEPVKFQLWKALTLFNFDTQPLINVWILTILFQVIYCLFKISIYYGSFAFFFSGSEVHIEFVSPPP